MADTTRSLQENFTEVLKLKSNPVGVRVCKDKEELEKGKKVSLPLNFCQLVKISAQSKLLLSCPKDKIGCFTAQLILGIREYNDKDLKYHMLQFSDQEEVARQLIKIKPKFKLNEIEGFLVGPPDEFDFDLLFIIVDSAQSLVLLEAFCAAQGKDLEFKNGVSSALCSYGCAYVYKERKPNLVIPCVGARRYGLFQDDELCFVFPKEVVDKVLKQLIEFKSKGRLHLPIVQGFLSPQNKPNYFLKKD